MSESGRYFEDDQSDSDEESEFSDEGGDYDEYSLGEYYDEEEELYEYEDSEGDEIREYEEEYSDPEPEIVTSRDLDMRGAAGESRPVRRTRGRVWDLGVMLAALCVALICGYYSVI